MKQQTHTIISDGVQEWSALKGIEQQITSVVQLICATQNSGKALYICGSGGSASDSGHIVGEFAKSFMLKRKVSPEFEQKFLKLYPNDCALLSKTQQGIRAYSLAAETPLMTAIVNDLGGEYIFSQQASAYICEGDILLAISTSGNSASIINAIKIAKVKGASVIGLSGATGGKMSELCDILLNVPETQTYKIQQLHLPLYHIICAAVEVEMFE